MRILGLEFGIGSFGSMNGVSMILICVSNGQDDICVPLILLVVLALIVGVITKIVLYGV